MPSLRRSIPSMSALATFEAAARLSSFTQAAAELGVTQAAVSRQIKLLEADLNIALFLRAHRRVALTPAGAALAATVGGAFAEMAAMIETIRRPDVADTVTVGATLAFSHLWILPRLSDFRARHPGVKLKLVAGDGATDLRRDRLDAVVRFGRPPFPDGRCVASRADAVFPVCSPALLDRLGMAAAQADLDLARLPLIASDTVNPSWLTWRTWGQAVGGQAGGGQAGGGQAVGGQAGGLGAALGRASDLSPLRFNHYTDTIEAALNAEGVALGWSMLLANHLETGRLVRIGTLSHRTADRYCLLVPAGREGSAASEGFTRWMIRQLGEESE